MRSQVDLNQRQVS